MTATITALRKPLPTRLLALPMLPREDRAAALAELAAEHVTGTRPHPARTEAEVRVFAHPSLSGEAALRAWEDYVGEEHRVQAVEAGEPFWRDLEPGLAQQDRDAALADLLDGTSTYHGGRTS